MREKSPPTPSDASRADSALNRSNPEDHALLAASSKRSRLVSLTPWEELTGRIVAVEETDGDLVIYLSTGTLRVDDTPAATAVLRRTIEAHEGCYASILRTDSDTEPLRVTVRPED